MTKTGPLRLLYGVGRPAFPFFIGGDGTIAHTILTGLTAMGVDGRFVGTFGDHVVTKLARLDDLAVPYVLDGETLNYRIPYPVTLASDRAFKSVVEKTIAELQPHVVFAQLDEAREILAIAKRHGCGTALYVLDVDYAENFRALAAEPDVIFTASHFARGELSARFGKEAHVLYPPVDVDCYRTPRREEFVTMINPIPVKGVEIALALAAALPRQQFLFVEGWRTDPAIVERIERLPNAAYMRKQIDMRAVYGKTRVLIVPSQWQEAFGRVVIEAQASGIPVIASRTGGLPEAVGRGGILIDDYRDPRLLAVGITALAGRPPGLPPALGTGDREHAAVRSSTRARPAGRDAQSRVINPTNASRLTLPSSERGMASVK